MTKKKISSLLQISFPLWSHRIMALLSTAPRPPLGKKQWSRCLNSSPTSAQQFRSPCGMFFSDDPPLSSVHFYFISSHLLLSPIPFLVNNSSWDEHSLIRHSSLHEFVSFALSSYVVSLFPCTLLDCCVSGNPSFRRPPLFGTHRRAITLPRIRSSGGSSSTS